MSRKSSPAPFGGSYLAYKLRDRPATRADMFIGIPLFLALGAGFLFRLYQELLVGEITIGRRMTAVWAENPGWFAFGVFIHVLLIFLMFLTPFAFVKKYRQQRRAKKQDWG